MEKANFKKYILRISLIFILLISAFLCIYTVWNYKSDNTMTQNNQLNQSMQSDQNAGMVPQNGEVVPESEYKDSTTSQNPGGFGGGNNSEQLYDLKGAVDTSN